MNTDQVRELVKEIRGMDYNVVGLEAINAKIKQITDDGWRLQVRASSDKVFRAKRGSRSLLKVPRTQWMVGAVWVRGDEKVPYYYQTAESKARAMQMQEENP